MRIIGVLVAAALLVGEAYPQNVPVSSLEYGKGGPGKLSVFEAVTGARIPCTGGLAGSFPCRSVDLLSYLPIQAIGGSNHTELNDIWGWTDPQTGREYALVGRSDGTSFVDVSDPQDPHYLGNLPSHDSTRSIWRDIKVLDRFAVIVADKPRGPDLALRSHGMQIFDLTRLREVNDVPAIFQADFVYDGFERAHNVVVNEDTEFAYAVGSETCGGGLHMIDLSDPLQPVFAGCFSHPGTGRDRSGYTHDAQCVIYQGPDADYQGREICFGSNETHVSIADVTDKANPIPISIADYPDVHYTHQAWLTPDHQYLLLDDELDEWQNPNVTSTRTIIFDVVDLDDPQVDTEYFGTASSIDHNQYVVEDRVYQANYTSGLRVLDISNIHAPHEVGYFDTYPENDTVGFMGAWSNYPFFESGIVIVSSINEGLFVLDPTGAAATPMDEHPELPADFGHLTAYPNPFSSSTTIRLQVDRPQHVRVTVHDVGGKEITMLMDEYVESTGHLDLTFDARNIASGVYLVRARGESAHGTVSVTVQK